MFSQKSRFSLVTLLAIALLPVSSLGQGGITTVDDALEFIIAGSTTIGIGTALFYDPLLCQKINAGITEYLARHELGSVMELVGSLNV